MIHTGDNMTKTAKTEITKIVNSEYGEYANFRFSTADDNMGSHAGHFNPNTMEIVMKSNSTNRTLAHEIAHAIQFSIEGDTDCMTGPLVYKFNAIETDMDAKIKNNGIAIAWNKATGWSVGKDWK